MASAENYKTEKQELAGIQVNVITYKIDSRYFCHVYNVNPGASISRADGASHEEAKTLALKKAQSRILSK
ncbi:MAG: hypothetical protein ACE5HS_12720 [bacterium]